MIAMTASPSLPESPIRPRVFGARPFHTDGELLALRFAADGSLWSVEEPGVLRHWDLTTRQQIGWHELGDPSAVWCFSASVHYLAAGSDELCLWETNDGELLACWPQTSWVTALAFQPGGLLLASGHDDGVVRLWDYTGERLAYELRGPTSPSGGARDLAVSALAFSSDGRRLAVAAEDRSILLWDMAGGELLGRLLGHTDRIPALAWHPDGRRLVSAGWDTTARVWDTSACLPLILLNSHDGQVQALAFTPDGHRLACADSAHAVHLWEMGPYQTLAVRRDHGREVRSLAFSPDGKCLASGGAGRVIHVWDAEPASSQAHAERSRTRSIRCWRGLASPVSADGRRLASLGRGTTLRVWNTATTEPLLELENAPRLRAFAASSDGRWFAGGVARPEGPEADRSTLVLWRADNGRRKDTFFGQAAPITVLAFSPDSRLLASAGVRSSDVWLWTIPDGETAAGARYGRRVQRRGNGVSPDASGSWPSAASTGWLRAAPRDVSCCGTCAAQRSRRHSAGRDEQSGFSPLRTLSRGRFPDAEYRHLGCGDTTASRRVDRASRCGDVSGLQSRWPLVGVRQRRSHPSPMGRS